VIFGFVQYFALAQIDSRCLLRNSIVKPRSIILRSKLFFIAAFRMAEWRKVTRAKRAAFFWYFMVKYPVFGQCLSALLAIPVGKHYASEASAICFLISQFRVSSHN
jgi:hypothetical protein